MQEDQIRALRRLAFSRAELFEGDLWHGCTPNSMANRIQSGFTRYFHGGLDIDGFCLSLNRERALEGFGRDRYGLGNGFHFDFQKKPLRIAHLRPDWLGVIIAQQLDHRTMASERTWAAAKRHGITLGEDGIEIDGHVAEMRHVLEELIPPTIDGIALPSWKEFEATYDPNGEAELVLCKDPQSILPNRIAGITIGGEDYPKEEGLEKLKLALVVVDDDWSDFDPPAQFLIPEVLEAVA